MMDPEEWVAEPVREIAATQTVLWDANVVSHLYRSQLKGNLTDPWRRLFDRLPASRRVVDEVVLWEIGRRFRGPDWRAWEKRHFQRVSLDESTVRRFVRLFERVRGNVKVGGPADGLIAAHCLASPNWVLATQNLQDFCEIPGLRIVVPPT